MQSVANEPLGTINPLTADWQVSTGKCRIDSRSQLQFYADYNPHASEQAGAGSCEVQVLYSNQPGDTATADIEWRGFCDEEDQGDGSSRFKVRTWTIMANATALFDRDPTWARPIASKIVGFRAREVGITTFGSITLRVAAQPF